MSRYLLATIAVACLALQATAVAQSASGAADGARPRVGLVLGGGGARGAAHIGVLRELERLRVPIDAIAGTSMGAVVGGLYASGKTPAELERIVASLDWQTSFRDRPKRRDMPFRRKQDDAAYPIRFELGLRDGGLRLPRGLIQGQKLGQILRELTGAASGIQDFDELPIPFRAVAADIATGETRIISSGDLPQALRASMSAPGIFAPVLVDGRSLVDGGLAGNVPVDAIQSMNVDVIIAVDVEFPLYPPEELDSAVAITGQVLTILIRKETQRQLEALGEDDILIRPELGQFGSTNFGEITEAIEPGADAVRAKEQRLRRLALDDGPWRRHLAARTIGDSKYTARTIDFVRINDNGPLSAAALKSHIQTKPGDRVDAERLAEDTGNIFSLDLYEQVSYRIAREGERTGVIFDTRPKAWGPNYLRFGIGLEDDFEGTTAFNLSARLTRTGVNRLGAEWRTDLQVGTEPRIGSEFYQPLPMDTRYFVAPRIRLEQRNIRTFSGDASIARYRLSETEAGIDLGRQLGRWGEFRIGAFRGTGEANLKVGDPQLPNFDFDSGGFAVTFSVDTLDDGQIPKHGSSLDLRWSMSRPGMGADSAFDTVTGDFNTVNTRGRHSLLFGLSVATTIESEGAVQNFFPLGGFLRMSGLARGELTGPNAGLARLVWYRQSGETGGGVFDVPLYYGASIESGNVWQRRSDIGANSLLMSGSLFVGFDTYFGPLYIAAGIAERGRTNFYLSLGEPPL